MGATRAAQELSNARAGSSMKSAATLVPHGLNALTL